ncbi:MAG TPA: hypothetical protein VHX39_00035 [Acetobacteraceae bacterium]|nr:hypothetical protein [Acetobacteraceae bacterium]
MKFTYTAGCMALLAIAQAYAQNVIVLPNTGEQSSSITVTRNVPVAVGQTFSMHFQLSQTLQGNASSTDLSNMMANASQTLYDLANRECELLTVAFKGTCRVTQVNVGANINGPMNGRGPVVNSNANATYEIDPAPAAAPTPSAAAPTPSAPAAPPH